MNVREAAPADIPAIARVHVDTWRAAYRGIVPDDHLDGLSYADRERLWTVALKPSNPTVVSVAEDEAGRVVGFAAGGPERSGDPDHRGEVYAIYVDASAQGHGLGRRLVADIARRLAGAGLTSLLIWVLADNPARGFYEALGGRYVRAQPVAMGDATLDEVAYGWSDTAQLRANL